MKRYISTIALCALTFIGLGSCSKVQDAGLEDGGTRTVSFQAQMGNDTRTGLALQFVPDWRETNLDNVHLFETHNNNVVEGKEKTMTVAPDSNNEVAYFTADFQDSWVIIVDPNEPSSAPATRASSSDYVYTSIVAQRDENDKYFVPAVQYPGAETLIDPDADFLVANGIQTYQKGQSNKQLDLRFIRPVSISRLSLMNIPDARVKEVAIYSEDALTASAAYNDVNFETSAVAFDEANGSKVLILSYGEEGALVPNEGIFNAYFVSLAGTKMITRIEVTTDVQTYTKEVNKSLVFKTPDFKNIAVNMEGAGGGVTTKPQTLSFVRGGKTFSVSNPDSYDLANGAANYVAPTLTGVQGTPAPAVTWTIVCNPANCAAVDQNGAVTLNGTGTATITATVEAVENFRETAASYKLVITETSTPQQTVYLTKGGKTITEDTFELGSGDYKMPVVETNALEYTVTWSVSNANASVVNNKVVPQAAGDVEVTATVVAPGYLDKEVTYTLHITAGAPAPTSSTYTLISGQTELVTGTYLVVSVNNQNKVLKGGTGDGADRGAVVDATASPMSLSGNTITITGDASVCEVYEYVITRTDNTITLYNSKLGYLKHDRPTGNGNSTTYIGFESTVSSSSTFTINTNPGTNNSGADAVFFSIRYTGSGSNSDEYLYYNTGGYFKLGGSGKPDTASGKYGGVFLYKKN